MAANGGVDPGWFYSLADVQDGVGYHLATWVLVLRCAAIRCRVMVLTVLYDALFDREIYKLKLESQSDLTFASL